MSKKTNKNKHLGQLAAKLKKIAPNVIGSDKEDFIKKHGGSHSTISRYLSGFVSDYEFGFNMLQEFNKKIKERDLALKLEEV